MMFAYYYFKRISLIKSNIIEISSSSWSYAGGAHGYGFADYSYYDLDKKEYFNLLDCYKEDVLDFIYNKVKCSRFKDDDIGGQNIDENIDTFFKYLKKKLLEIVA